MVVVWIVAAAALLALEVHTTAFYAVFVAAGLVAAAIAAVLGAELWVQVLVLALVASVGVVVARPPLLRILQRRRPSLVLAGVQNLVGQRALTVDEVGDQHHPGHVLLAGEHWLAVSTDDRSVPAGVVVVVTAVRGTTLVVRAATDTVA